MDHNFIFLLLFAVFSDDSEVEEAAAWKHYLFLQWTKKSILYEELSCKGRKGRGNKILANF